jgi:Helix-turn-helix domain of resolvase
VGGQRRLTEAQRHEIVKLYRDGTPVPELAALVGCGVTTAYRVLGETASLPKRGTRRRRKYRYRADLFAEPLTDPELWLFGLLMADGNVNRRGARITLGLSARDLDAVNTARRVAGSDAPIAIHERSRVNPLGIRSGAMAVWELYSRDVVARVTALGMAPGKSYRTDVHVPPTVALSPSFWRGLIDGDGTVRLNRSRTGDKTRERPWMQVLGSRALLEQWRAFVVASIGGPAPGLRPVPGTTVLHASTLTCSRAWDMVEILYGQGGPALERKREAAPCDSYIATTGAKGGCQRACCKGTRRDWTAVIARPAVSVRLSADRRAPGAGAGRRATWRAFGSPRAV